MKCATGIALLLGLLVGALGDEVLQRAARDRIVTALLVAQCTKADRNGGALMFDDAIRNHPSVKAVQAKFPGAALKEVRRHQPGARAGASKIGWQDLLDFASSERDRAEVSLLDCLADGSDLAQTLAADHARTVAVFEKMAELVRRVRSSSYIKNELRIIADREAAEAAEAADAAAETDEA